MGIGLTSLRSLLAVALGLAGTMGAIGAQADGAALGTTFRDCDVCPDMVVVPAGHFLMGSEGNDSTDWAGRPVRETPVHRVDFARPFAIGRFEVTVAEHDACVRDKACADKTQSGTYMMPPGHARGMVSWDEVQAYIRWLSARTGQPYRLPSEAEWEYAARGGTTGAYWWGDTYRRGMENNKGDEARWSRGGASPVGTFPANPFGLHDMLGNHYEWVADCWNPSHEGAPRDGAARTEGDCELRVVKGGYWGSDAFYTRSAYRYRILRIGGGNDRGFRVVRELP